MMPLPSVSTVVRFGVRRGAWMPTRHRSSTVVAAAGCPIHATAGLADDPPAISGDTLPYEAIPSPKGLPVLGTVVDLIRSGGAAYIHEYCDRRHQELGPIFREKIGTLDVVALSDQNLVRRVYAAEGKYPVHLVPEPWVIYNKKKNITRGLFFMDGEEWAARRVMLNELFLEPEAVSKHQDTFNEVVTDLIDRWGKLSAKGDVIPSLENELYNWSIETLGTMVFGRRLGCVRPAECTSEMHEFVQYVQQIFEESATMAVLPPKLAHTLKLPVWRRFEKAADKALAMSRGYVLQRIAEINALKSKGVPVDGVMVEMMENPCVTQEEIVNIVADLILAAADTTSHATQWALHSLATNPEAQELLFNEVNAIVPKGELIQEHHVKKIESADWIIKETLRMYPIASFLTRVLPDKITLANYEIPAGKMFFMSQYTCGRDPVRFPQPEKFIPQRWARVGPQKSLPAHGCIPFGINKRACIGKKIAELKMKLLLTRTVQKYHLESANDKKVGIMLRMITVPDQPIKIRLVERAP